MSPRRSPLAAFPPLVLSACVPSLHPFYIERNLSFDAALLGIWTDEKRRHLWDFSEGCDLGYSLLHTDEENRASRFVAHLFRFDGVLLMDLWPWNFDAHLSPLQSLHVLPAHSVMLVRQLEPALHVAFLSYAAIRRLLERDSSAISHVCPRSNEFVLTALPNDLQRFIVHHERTARASIFAATLALKRNTGI